jgi:hypothetical protein
MQFPPVLCYLLSHRPIYLSQHEYIVYFLQYKRPSFTPIQNNKKNYSFLPLIFTFLDTNHEDKRSWTKWQQALSVFNLLSFFLAWNIINIWPMFHLNFNEPKKLENVTTDMSLCSLPVMTWYNTGQKTGRLGWLQPISSRTWKTILWKGCSCCRSWKVIFGLKWLGMLRSVTATSAVPLYNLTKYSHTQGTTKWEM